MGGLEPVSPNIEAGNFVQTVVTAFRVLEELAKRQPVGASDFAREMGLPKSTMYRILKSLQKAGWIRPSNGPLVQWVLTAQPVILAQFVASDLGIREAARPVMENLRDLTTEAVHLAIPENNEIVVLDRIDSLQAVRIYWPAGQHGPTYATANGKALLAFSPAERRARMLPAVLARHTERTITDPAELDRELERIRVRGWATSFGEFRPEFGSIAAPIVNTAQIPIASLSVFFPEHRTPADGGAEWGRLARGAAEQVSAAVASLNLSTPIQRGELQPAPR